MNKRGLKNDGSPDLRTGKIKHGLTNHPLYEIWGSMKARCCRESDRAYKWYGALGIRVCPEWYKDFKHFYDWAIANGYERGLTIERKRNELGYSPENCEWVARSEQNKNRRSNYQIKYGNETKTLAEWCRIFHIEYMLVLQRIHHGWDFEKAVTTKSRRPKINNL